MGMSILEMVATIVAGQSSQRTLSGEEIDELIKHTYRSLKEIEALESSAGGVSEIELPIGIQSTTSDVHQSKTEQTAAEPVIDPQNSIRDDSIVCVLCGKEFKQLTHTHLLRAHGISPDEYRRRYGIPMKQPLAAGSVSQKRKDQAKERNVGEQLRLARAAKKIDQSRNIQKAEKKELSEESE
ncbi:MAG: MucR family transcriptional regulator [Syntrophobacteraceae bacterium]